MGMTHVTVTIRNPADPGRSWEGLFLVDTCSWDTLVPGKALREIGVEPMGDYTFTTVIFGRDDVEPILGVTALESVGIEVDPRTQQLKRLPAVRLK
jgi:hypothetical protein